MERDVIRQLTEVSERSKSNTHRIDALEKHTQLMHEMNKNIAVIAEQTKGTKEDIEELKEDVEEIKGKPNKLLDSVKEKALAYVVTALLGAALALLLG